MCVIIGVVVAVLLLLRTTTTFCWPLTINAAPKKKNYKPQTTPHTFSDRKPTSSKTIFVGLTEHGTVWQKKKLVAAAKAVLPLRGNTGARGWNWYYKAKANAKIEEAVVEFPDNETSVERKKVFFDVGINDEDQGRIIFELANDLVPTGGFEFFSFLWRGRD